MTDANENREFPAAFEATLDQAAQAVAVQTAQLDELNSATVGGPGLGMGNLMDVPVRVTVEIGRKRVTLAELARLGPGALLVLEREAHEPADILVNGKVVARGEVVTVDGSFGVRVTEVLGG